MAEKKDQYIAAYISDYSRAEIVLSYAFFMATMLKKGLILLRIVDSRYSGETTAEAEVELKKIQSQIRANIPNTYCVLKGKSKEILSALPAAFNDTSLLR